MPITERVEKIRQNYVNTKPHISYERAWSWTKSFQKTEGQAHILRTAQAFKDTCEELSVNIWEGELVVGTSGEYRRKDRHTGQQGEHSVGECCDCGGFQKIILSVSIRCIGDYRATSYA